MSLGAASLLRMGKIGQRVDENMRLMASQTPPQLAINLAVMVGVLSLLALLGVFNWSFVIGGTLGYLVIQAIARFRHR